MKTHYGKMRSIFAKLDNQLGANKAAMAKKKHDKENAKKENKYYGCNDKNGT